MIGSFDFGGYKVPSAPEAPYGARFVRIGIDTSHMGRNYPTDVALGPDGTLYVADGFNDRVQAFAPTGEYLRRWGGPFGLNIRGSLNGWFDTVTSIAVDSAGNVFVADFHNHRVQKFAPDGTFLCAFGEPGSELGQFGYVNAVAVADDGSVFVTDLTNHRVQKWQVK